MLTDKTQLFLLKTAMNFGFCGMKRKIIPPAGFFAGVRVVVVSCYYMPRDAPTEGGIRVSERYG